MTRTLALPLVERLFPNLKKQEKEGRTRFIQSFLFLMVMLTEEEGDVKRLNTDGQLGFASWQMGSKRC